MTLLHCVLPTPLGPVHVAARGEALAALAWDGAHWPRVRDRLDAPLVDGPPPPAVAAALEAYFAGQRGALDALPVDPAGTPYERRVWALLRAIPAGRTLSYAELAARAGSSPRAVGGANARNPVSLVVPCHRVVGADGALTGYAGGVERKRRLLELEGAQGRG